MSDNNKRIKIKKYNRQMTFNIDDKMKAEMNDACDYHIIPVSEFIRESIRRNIDYYNEIKKSETEQS